MTNDVDSTKLEIAFGRRTFPESVRAVWGARLIWPDDIVWDRQDLAGSNPAMGELTAWLNGPGHGDGAIAKMRDRLRDPYSLGLRESNDNEAVIYEDETGKIVGSAQSSYGYLYVCGWLHDHAG